jgi:WD40-like Beta Propeller Repeat
VKRFGALAAAAAMTWLAMVGVGASVQAVVPGANGRIVFTRAICDSETLPCWEIVTANADDTNEIVVAGPYPRRVWDDHFIANWSPDGRSVIFMARQKIWQVNADGTGLHKVWTPPHDGSGMDDGPAFTPDGRYIIFTRCCPKPSGYGQWRIDADGSHLRVVTREVAGVRT